MKTTFPDTHLRRELKFFVSQTVSEILNDPDFCLSLTDKAKKRLRAARARRDEKTLPLTEIRKRYYL